MDIYNNALRFQALNQISDAEALLRQLINENIPQLENEGGLPKTMSTIKYSCYVNLGNIAIQKNNSIEALDNYLHVRIILPTFISVRLNLDKRLNVKDETESIKFNFFVFSSFFLSDVIQFFIIFVTVNYNCKQYSI